MRALFHRVWAPLVATSALAGLAHAEIFDIIVGPGGDFVFSQPDITIEVGDTVRWTWESAGHNVGSGLPGDPTPFFLSGPPADVGTIFEVTFDQAFLDANAVPDNIYAYHCHPHGDLGMVGSITVVPAPGSMALFGVALIASARRRRR